MPKQAQTLPKQWILTKIMPTQSMASYAGIAIYPLQKTNGQKWSPDAMIRVEAVAYDLSRNDPRDFTYVKIYLWLIRLLYIR